MMNITILIITTGWGAQAIFRTLEMDTPSKLFLKPLREAKDENANDMSLVEWMHDMCGAGFPWTWRLDMGKI